MVILTALAVLGVFALLACSSAALLRTSGGWGADERLLALAVGVVVAPALAGLSLLPFFLSGWQPGGVRWWPVVLALAMLLPVGLRRWRDGRAGAGQWRRPDLVDMLLAAGALALALVLLSMPLIENDALEYAAVARFIASQGDLARYPLVAADPASGLYAPSIHPPLFHLTLVWGSAWFGGDSFMAQRLVAVWSALGTTLVVGAVARPAGRTAAILSMLLLTSIPFWLGSVLGYGIDAMRIALFTAAVAAVLPVAERPTMLRAAGAGVLGGLAMWAHGIGVLAPAFAGAAMALHLGPRRGWRPALIFGLVALFVGAGWLVRNQVMLGVAVGDDWPAANWPELAFAADLAARRGLADLPDQILDGALRPWTDIGLFGPVFWLALLALPLLRRPGRALALAVFVVGGFVAMALLTVSLGTVLVVKNARYVLTVAPFAALAAGIALARLREARPAFSPLVAGVMALSLGWAGANLGIRLVGVADPVLAFYGRERGFLERPRVTGGPLLAGLDRLEPGRVLSFRPPEVAIYGERAWIDHIDPRLKDLHAGTREAAARWLASQNVRLALLPDYSPVTHGRSTLGLLLADPAWAEPLGAHRNARLFRLRESPAALACVPQALGAALVRRRSAGFGDLLARLSGIPHLRAVLPGRISAVPGNSVDWSRADGGEIDLPVAEPFEGRFAVDLRIAGEGVFAVDAVLAGAAGETQEIRLVDALADAGGREVAGQWFGGPGQKLTGLRVRPLAPGAGRIVLQTVALCRVGG